MISDVGRLSGTGEVMNRVVVAALKGALFGGGIGAAFPLVIGGATFLFSESHPMDREYDLAVLLLVAAFCAISAAIVGALAGLASQIPTYGVGFLRCYIVIAFGAGIARVLTAPTLKTSDAATFFFSYVASFAVACFVAGILTWIGLTRDRAVPAKGSDSPK